MPEVRTGQRRRHEGWSGIGRGGGGLDDVAQSQAAGRATSGSGLWHANAGEGARGRTVRRPIPSVRPPCPWPLPPHPTMLDVVTAHRRTRYLDPLGEEDEETAWRPA